MFKNGSDNIICVHNNDMILLDTTEFGEVLNCVLNAFAFYTGWDNTMMNLLTSGAMLQDLMDASAEILKNPAFILGSATYIDPGNFVTQGMLDSFLLFCRYVDQWFQLHIMEQESLILDEQIRAVISDRSADSTELRRRLSLYGWKETDPLIFFKLDAPYQPFNINSHLCHTLNADFSNFYAVTTDLSICVLCNISEESLDKTGERLMPWLKSSKYYATMSQVFSMKDSFYDHYRYAEKISAFVGKEIGNIYSGKDYVLPYILSEMQRTVVSEALHPALKTLREYDLRHHTAFYDTLYVYLKNERSIAQTARELNLHRNPCCTGRNGWMSCWPGI